MTEDKIKHAMDFYMLANNLKFATNDGVQSIADEVYGSITLAAAINSEYNRVENLGETMRIILLSAIEKFYPKELQTILGKLTKGEKYLKELSKYHDPTNLSNKTGTFAFECALLELTMTYFFEILSKEEEMESDDITFCMRELREFLNT